MLIIFAILYVFQRFLNTDTGPLSVHFSRQTNIDSPPSQECVCQNLRSIWDIIWSCLATIFLCSWVSVHPNIPEKGEPWWQKALRRMELMFWSIISPELVIFWAISQWLGARKLNDIYKHHGWTKTHGYFVQMGGFMLYEGEKAVGVLDPQKLESLLSSRKITLPSISEEDIQDRSKGDGLAKALVIVQTAWFIVQCIARRVQGLVITEIELVTLAFATLNSVMYFLWWNKPLNVESTVPVYLKPVSVRRIEPSEDGECRVEIVVQVDDVEGANIENGKCQVESVANAGDNRSGINQEIDLELANSPPSPEVQLHPRHRVIHNIHIEDLASRAWWFLSGIVFRWPATGIVVIVKRIYDIWDTDSIGEGKMRVNTFYAYNFSYSSAEDNTLLATLPFVGALFGAIHCAGWNFVFPSLIEANTWRVSSAIITGVPVIGFLSLILSKLNEDNKNFLVTFFGTVFLILTIVLFPFYILARLALLVEALISLRDLHPGTLEVVEWTSFLPHI